MTMADGEAAGTSPGEEISAAGEYVPAPVVAVVGRPNVGKSTLVNRILGSRQAVVQDTPGVTRDRVAYDASWRGRAFTLVDTGGWEPSPGSEAGQASRALAEQVTAQARLAVETADAVLFVVDVTVGITDADEAVAAVLRRSGKPVVVAANKVDDAPGEPAAAALWSLGLGEPYPGSALHGRGSGGLLGGVVGAAPGATPPGREAGRSARGGADRPAQRGQVQPAQPAGGRAAGVGARGRRDHQGSGGRADRARRGDLAVRGHRGHTPAGQGEPGRGLLRGPADRRCARAGRGRRRAGGRQRTAGGAGPAHRVHGHRRRPGAGPGVEQM